MRNATLASSMTMSVSSCLNIFYTPQEVEQQHKDLCVVKDNNNIRQIIFPTLEKEVKWRSEDDFKLNEVPTYLVADLECVLTKIDEKEGMHNHITYTNTSHVPL